MRASTMIVAASLALACAAAQAQAYRWVDKDGKTRYGDSPPAGVKATPMKSPASGAGAPGGAPAASGAAAAKDGAKDAKKAPVTPEQAFKERQLKTKEDAEKADKEAAAAQSRKVNCERAQAQLRNLESGQRITVTTGSGERAYLEDAERPAKIAEAQRAAADWCK